VPPIIATRIRHYAARFTHPHFRAPASASSPARGYPVPAGIRDKRDRQTTRGAGDCDEIEALLADERFAGRTLGVVSLLERNRRTTSMSSFGVNAMRAELIRRPSSAVNSQTCGARPDIIFLSMVVIRTCRPCLA